jgi:hypothetical protein
MREYVSDNEYNIKGRGKVFCVRTLDNFARGEVIKIDGKEWQVINTECSEKPGFGRDESIGIIVKEPVVYEEAKEPRLMSLVKLQDWSRDNLKESGQKPDYPLLKETVFVYMGEIPNMRGHCVVYGRDTKEMYVGYHTDNFVELTEEEV